MIIICLIYTAMFDLNDETLIFVYVILSSALSISW